MVYPTRATRERVRYLLLGTQSPLPSGTQGPQQQLTESKWSANRQDIMFRDSAWWCGGLRVENEKDSPLRDDAGTANQQQQRQACFTNKRLIDV